MQKILDREVLQQELMKRYEDAKLVWGEHADKQHRIGRGASRDVKNFVRELQDIKAKRVLDLGCGNGRNSIYLAEHGFHVVAADFVPKAIELTRKKIEEKNLGNRIDTVLLDSRKTPFPDSSFDAVVCGEMLDLMMKEEIRSTVGNIHRMLKPGGALLVRVLSDKTDSPIQKWKGRPLDGEEGTFASYRYDHRFEKRVIRVSHMFSEKEMGELFGGFDIKELKLVESRDRTRYAHNMVAFKKTNSGV